MSIINHDSLLKEFGIPRPTILRDMCNQTAMVDEILLEIFGADFRPLRLREPSNWKPEISEDNKNFYYIDEFGCKLAMPKIGGHYFDIIDHPLEEADINDIDKYKGPDFSDKQRYIGIKREAEFLYDYTDYAITGDFASPGIFELSWFLRGMENFLIDLVTNEKFACALMDKVIEIVKKLYDAFLKECGKYIHIVPMHDDLSSQTGPLINPELYRRLIKPRHKELIKFIKERTDAKIFFHNDGSMKWQIPDLIEIGIDIINPVQVDAYGMDPGILKKEFGNKIIFWGSGIDTHNTLSRGTVKEIEIEVKKRIKELAPGGGYIFNQVHNIQSEAPPENIIATFMFAQKYGNYPINNKE
jgi:uroporphyrinogen decarboxylase